MIGRTFNSIRTFFSTALWRTRYLYQKIAVRIYITFRPPLFRLKCKYVRSRPWMAGLILVAMLSSCMTCSLVYVIGGSYSDDAESVDIVGNILNYLRRTGVVQDVDPDRPLFEPAPCMFGNSETWWSYETPEKAGYICGYVQVPFYHEEPDGAKIKVPVAILPSNDQHPKPDPLFLAQGGPGAASLDLYPTLLMYSSLHRDRDLVMVDQRGTRYAEPALHCLQEDFHEPLNGSDYAENATYLEGLEACNTRLDAEVGDLRAFTTPQMAGDINAVRQALGYKQINFYGVSYGTHIGQYLIEMYPEVLRSVILDGVAPVPFDYINEMVFTHDRVLQELFANCERDPVCSKAYPDLESRMQALLVKLDQEPVLMEFHDPNSFASFEDELDGYGFINMIMGLFYYDRSYAILPYLIQQAEQGNYEYFELIGDYTYYDWSFSNEVYLTVLCSEHEAFGIDRVMTKDARPWLLGYERDDWVWYDQACDAWSTMAPEKRLAHSVHSDIPVLLLSGQYDPVTPPEYAEEAKVGLRNSYHIVDPQGSHGVAFSDGCTEGIVNSFLYNPNVEPRHSCLGKEDRRVDVVPPDAIQLRFLMSSFAFSGIIEGSISLFATLLGMMILVTALSMLRALWARMRRKQLIWVRGERGLRLIHQILIFSFTIAALCYGSGISVAMIEAQTSISYADAFALPGEARTLLALPLIMIPLSIEVFISGTVLWRREILSRMEKNHFGLFSLIMFGYMGFLLLQGLVIRPF